MGKSLMGTSGIHVPSNKELDSEIKKLWSHIKEQDARIKLLEKDLEARETLEMERSEL